MRCSSTGRLCRSSLFSRRRRYEAVTAYYDYSWMTAFAAE